jgi:hypothetical protein
VTVVRARGRAFSGGVKGHAAYSKKQVRQQRLTARECQCGPFYKHRISPSGHRPTSRSSTAAPATGHPAHAILHLQRTIGNQAVLRLLRQAEPGDPEAPAGTKEVTRSAHEFGRIPERAKSPASVQAKLTVGAPGDSYEQEADRVSEQVMRMPQPQLQRACSCGGGCPECQTGQLGRGHETLQTKRVHAGDSDTGRIAAPPIVHEVLGSPGQPLDAATRAFMEPRFGHDFSRVRVHTDGLATDSAATVDARAYTVGSHVVFGRGQYSPTTHQGRRLRHSPPAALRRSCSQTCSTMPTPAGDRHAVHPDPA